MKKMITLSVLTLLLYCIASIALAQFTPQISYQGRVTDINGNPVSDGYYEMNFALYDLEGGTVPNWSETHPSVYTQNGFFSVYLGITNPLSDTVFSAPIQYLEITVNGEIMSPRVQLTASPYSFRTATIDGAHGGEVYGEVSIWPETRYEEKALGGAGIVMYSDRTGTSFSMYEPADSKVDKAMDLGRISLTLNDKGEAAMSFYEPADSKRSFAAADLLPSIKIGLNDLGEPVIQLYEPADSKITGESTKKIEMRSDGIFMFGLTDADTNLMVAPNGDIVGKGQITMGQNSSSGTQTSVLGFENTADGDSSTIGGGSGNYTTGTISVISGGHANTVSGEGGTIGGGAFNDVSGMYATIAGGLQNVAIGDFSTIPGGDANLTQGNHSYAAGHRAKALYNGSFVWADQTDEDFSSTGEDQFIIRAGGGVGINTDSPQGILDVVGPSGDGSVNLPGDAISSPEILDEPGLAANRTSSEFALTQESATVESLISTTITIPADGYIIVRGIATMSCNETTKRNQAYMQIDDTPGGTLEDPYYVLAGNGEYDTPHSEHFYILNNERIFNRPAGTYTFYLEFQAHPDNGPTAVTTIERPFISATYIPTAYGSVTDGN